MHVGPAKDVITEIESLEKCLPVFALDIDVGCLVPALCFVIQYCSLSIQLQRERDRTMY